MPRVVTERGSAGADNEEQTRWAVAPMLRSRAERPGWESLCAPRCAPPARAEPAPLLPGLSPPAAGSERPRAPSRGLCHRPGGCATAGLQGALPHGPAARGNTLQRELAEDRQEQSDLQVSRSWAG